jgi:hypothetical protein
VRSVPVTVGRSLLRVAGTWESIVVRDELNEAYLDLVVTTAGPEPDLMERARERFPRVVKVRADYPRRVDQRPSTAGRPWGELYAEYHGEAHAAPPSAELLALFEEIREEAGDASA